LRARGGEKLKDKKSHKESHFNTELAKGKEKVPVLYNILAQERGACISSRDSQELGPVELQGVDTLETRWGSQPYPTTTHPLVLGK